MKYQNKFSIFRDAIALVVALEEAVKHFPRYHKYTLGSECHKFNSEQGYQHNRLKQRKLRLVYNSQGYAASPITLGNP